MPRRKPPEWFTFTDERTLEYLADEGISTPSEISSDDVIRRYRTHINNRLRLLDDADLVNRVGYGEYVITDLGSDYLYGDADLTDLAEPGSGPETSKTMPAAP